MLRRVKCRTIPALCFIVSGVLLVGCTGPESRFERASRMVDEMRVQAAVEAYENDHGTSPFSLSELVPDYLDTVPAEASGEGYLRYNMETGIVSLAEPASSPESTEGIPMMTEQDYVNLERIANALDEFFAMYRQYPATLDDLPPRFMDEVPRIAANGAAYVYFPDTGEVYHPAELVTEPESMSGGILADPEASSAASTGGSVADQIANGQTPSPERVLEEGERVVRQYEQLMDELNL